MKDKVCIIGGTSLHTSKFFKDFEKVEVKNKYGQVSLFRKGNIYFLQRHYGNFPPHSINFKAYFKALVDFKVNKVLAVYSVGSLKNKIKSGQILVPDDFISPWNIPTFFDNEIVHITPSFSEELRKIIFNICKDNKINCLKKGVYVQAIGPRFETRAEIKMFSTFADVVGMTLASEITIANELKIDFAAICSVDNYANGIKSPVDWSDIKKEANKNKEKIERIIQGVINKFK